MGVGVFGRPHGVNGEIALRPYNVRGRDLSGLRAIWLVRDGRREPRTVIGCRAVEGGYLVRLDGVADRQTAATLTLAEVRVARATLPALGPGEFYVEDVPGCVVEDEAGRPLGAAVGTFWNGAHDVVTVVEAGGRERLIPLVPNFVLAVDIPGRSMRVRWDDDDL